MNARALLHLFGREFDAVLVSVYRFMFRAVVHIKTPYVFQKQYQGEIGYKYNQLYNAEKHVI